LERDVNSTNDQTAHAEGVAIHRACAAPNIFNLSDCDLCEPRAVPDVPRGDLRGVSHALFRQYEEAAPQKSSAGSPSSMPGLLDPTSEGKLGAV
jgi:hypothetical protein